MEAMIMELLNSFAHQPLWVYLFIFVFMYASSFGFPVPEEVILLTVGFLAYVAAHPEAFPAGDVASSGVNIHMAAWLCFVAVVSSDALVYFLGRRFGPRILSWKPVRSLLNDERRGKVEHWTRKLGPFAAGFFRFTPGIRFPGHLSCGILGVPFHTFLLVDGLAALVSVPTQVYLVGFYGKEILDLVRKYQPFVLALAVVFLLIHFRGPLLMLLRPRAKRSE